jgi:hypothetical protein
MGRSAAAAEPPVDRDAEVIGRIRDELQVLSKYEASGTIRGDDGEAPARPSPNGAELPPRPQARALTRRRMAASCPI